MAPLSLQQLVYRRHPHVKDPHAAPRLVRHRRYSSSNDAIRQGASTILLTTVAMIAFAANSLLCRMALGAQLIDAATFTTVEAVVRRSRSRVARGPAGAFAAHCALHAVAVGALFGYAIAFSFAYLGLSAGTGAADPVRRRADHDDRFAGTDEESACRPWGGQGSRAACAGLVLCSPPASPRRPLMSALLMTLAGMAWEIYSLRGRAVSDPLQSTAANFVWTVPARSGLDAHACSAPARVPSGTGLAAASGALASGLGYVVWYAALRRLPAIPAATVQLSVPVIAALGGVLLLESTQPRASWSVAPWCWGHCARFAQSAGRASGLTESRRFLRPCRHMATDCAAPPLAPFQRPKLPTA